MPAEMQRCSEVPDHHRLQCGFVKSSQTTHVGKETPGDVELTW